MCNLAATVNGSRQIMQIVSAPAPSLIAYCKELFAYRQVLRFFIWRDIAVRYKQTFLGFAWVVIKPLLTMLLFSFVFGFIARFPSENVSYPLFVLAGMLPWQYFANCSMDSCVALLNNSSLITKAYFPRLILPISTITAQSLDLAVNTFLFVLLVPLLGNWPPLENLLFIPFIAVWTYLLCLGMGIWLAAVTTRYRDIKFLVTFLVQFGMFLSPIGYGTFLIPGKWVYIYMLNPLVGLIDAYRWVFLGISHPYLIWTVSYSIAATLLLCLWGILSFKKTENQLIDLL